MIDLYVWGTPNGRKPLILLEELGIPYNMHPVDISKGAQNEPEFRKLNPNGRIPAMIVDKDVSDEIRIFESGAILIHLAEKADKYLPKSGQSRADVLSWLMWQMGGVGPMFGQLGHFRMRDEKLPYPIERYTNEVERLITVLDGRLAQVDFVGGEYSIADMSIYPWVSAVTRFGMTFDKWPNVKRWVDTLGERPAVKKAMEIKFG